MPTYAFVGLDVSQADARVCFLLADGAEPWPRWTIPNTQPGAEALSGALARLCQVPHGLAYRFAAEQYSQRSAENQQPAVLLP